MAMKLPRRQFLHIAAGAALLPSLPRPAQAEDYPTRPVHIIVPVPPGGTFDIMGRLIAQWLSKQLGHEFVVDNRGGAGTKLGTDLVAHAPPDGYTLLLAGTPAAINETLYRNLNYDFRVDMAAVGSIEAMPLIMSVNPTLPVKTVPQFISYAKANPGKINMGSGGSGSTGHVAGELFNMMAGIKLAHVPYRGEAPALTDLLGGQVQVVFATAGSSISYVRAHTLRALAVTSGKRMDVLPDVPTVTEFLPGYEATAWAGIAAPAKTPVAIVDKLNRTINAALADSQFKSRLTNLGALEMGGSPADFGKFVASEIDKWGKVIKFANIQPEQG
jgi:tripartite-type tricarboxylate transporter receptor subunit TctC